MDGTLVDSLSVHYLAMVEVFNRARIVPPTFAQFRGLKPPFSILYRARGVRFSSKKIWQIYNQTVLSNNHEIRPFYDALPFLTAVKGRFRIVVVSGAQTMRVRMNCDHFGFTPFLSCIIGRAELKEMTFRRFPNSISISDYAPDTYAARRAGIVPVGLTRGLSDHLEHRQEGAHWIAQSLQRCLPFVLQ